MNKCLLLLSVAPAVLFSTALRASDTSQAGKTTENAPTGTDGKTPTATVNAEKAKGEAVFSTGVAKGRDRLDSATSTSALKASDAEAFGARSLGEILRNIPGIRAEYAIGEGNAGFSIRGLPLAATGSKFMQLQEDGLPVLEFGDLTGMGPDMLMRADLNLAQVEAIRGGSASTFASNSPGGVINLISKTGDVEGGAIQSTLGLNYGEHRLDADYGHKLSDTVRFHIGGFYRQGEGPRTVGYDAYKGGQIKFNVTKQFTNGFVRIYGKYLDDRAPSYQFIPVTASGTDANPVFSGIANIDAKAESLMSRNVNSYLGLDGNNRVAPQDGRDGQHAKSKAVGFEAQFDIGGWSISEKFRFSANSGNAIKNLPSGVVSAATFGGPGARLSYATGPLAGQSISSPSTLNGNGLLVSSLYIDWKLNNLDNTTNDLRASRVWKIGGGDFTATVGFYKSEQAYNMDFSVLNILSDVNGGGNAALVNVTNAAGVPTTQNGYLSFGLPNGQNRRHYGMKYHVNAPYGSVNYHIGKLAIGGSLRYDSGSVNGTVLGADLGGGRIGVAPIDINGDGLISIAESKTAVLPLSDPSPVDYTYHYLSYSVGANFRIAESLAVFARNSRGARASADRILFTPAVNVRTGGLTDPAAGFDTVKQSEIGLKFRTSDVSFNITGFSATAGDRNAQPNVGADGVNRLESIVRRYSAKGVELETEVHRGPFSLSAGATYTKAKIAGDVSNPKIVGNVPRHQADLIFEATPQVDTKYVTVGANFIGTTSSFAQDTDQLTLPGYTLVNAFVQIRPIARVQVMLNANNVFDTLALADVSQASIPANGIVLVRAYNGRTLSGTLRYAF